MTLFTLTMETTTAAFGETDTMCGWEVAAILRKAATEIEQGAHTGKLRDANGNTIGHWALE